MTRDDAVLDHENVLYLAFWNCGLWVYRRDHRLDS
jgi:hypothetical protein